MVAMAAAAMAAAAMAAAATAAVATVAAAMEGEETASALLPLRAGLNNS